MPFWGFLAGAAVCAGVAMRSPAGLDYWTDAAPAIEALARGDLAGVSEMPLMGPLSLVLRAPVVALGDSVGAGDLLLYRLGALICLLPVTALVMWLWHLMDARGRSVSVRVAVAGLVLANPMTFHALSTGHPEEPLAAALSVGAVLAAYRGRVWPAVVLLGLAVATKQWALLAAPVVLVALPPGRRLRPTLICLTAGVALWAPLALLEPHAFFERNVLGVAALDSTRTLPLSLWWPLASPGHPDGGASLEGWVATLTHPMVVLAALLLSLGWWRRHRGDPRTDDVLLLLALVFLLRCVLDPLGNGYYHVPFLFALLAWESLSAREYPWFSILSSGVLWVLVVLIWPTRQYDLMNALYLAWALPVAAYLAYTLFEASPQSKPRHADSRIAASPDEQTYAGP